MADDRHVHHSVAKHWFEQAEGTVIFCRQTRSGFLRLLTQPRVMGSGVLNPPEAWEMYRNLRRDSRVVFEAEPANIEALWRTLSVADEAKTNHWTDTYLAAFALERGHSFRFAASPRSTLHY